MLGESVPMLSAAALFLITAFQSLHLQNKDDSKSLKHYVECDQERKKMVKVRSSVRKKQP